MIKKIIFTMMLITVIAMSSGIHAGRSGFGAGLGIGLLGGALATSAAYNSGYGYYPPQPYGYAYGPQYSFYAAPVYNPYW